MRSIYKDWHAEVYLDLNTGEAVLNATYLTGSLDEDAKHGDITIRQFMKPTKLEWVILDILRTFRELIDKRTSTNG